MESRNLFASFGKYLGKILLLSNNVHSIAKNLLEGLAFSLKSVMNLFS